MAWLLVVHGELAAAYGSPTPVLEPVDAAFDHVVSLVALRRSPEAGHHPGLTAGVDRPGRLARGSWPASGAAEWVARLAIVSPPQLRPPSLPDPGRPALL
jgi:hypothetical protein